MFLKEFQCHKVYKKYYETNKTTSTAQLRNKAFMFFNRVSASALVSICSTIKKTHLVSLEIP